MAAYATTYVACQEPCPHLHNRTVIIQIDDYCKGWNIYVHTILEKHIISMEIRIYTQPPAFYCHLSASNDSNDRLFTIYASNYFYVLISKSVCGKISRYLPTRKTKRLRCPAGTFEPVQFCFLVAWIILRDSGLIAVVRRCCSSPGDARRQRNFLHVTCLSGETPSRRTRSGFFFFFHLCHDFSSAAVVEMVVNGVIC